MTRATLLSSRVVGSARVAGLGWLLALAFASSAAAQASEPADTPSAAQPSAPVPAPSTAPPVDPAIAPSAAPSAVPPASDQPVQTGYEPDQRGAIDSLDGLSPGPEPSPSAAPPPAPDVQLSYAPASGDMSEAESPPEREEPAPRRFYLELQGGYGSLDPSAFQGPAIGHHGYTLGVAAGLHLEGFDAGVRYVHGLYSRGLDLDAPALEARLPLAEGAVVPQLRLAIGLLWLSDAGVDGGTLFGALIEPGVGARVALDETFSLGAALDLGFSRTNNARTDAAGFELSVHLDLGAHF